MRYTLHNWLTGTGHAAALLIAARINTFAAWRYGLAAMAATSFFGWVAYYRRYRQVSDLPASKVGSAAQGYVELAGHAELIDGEPVLSPLSNLPCCWYRYLTERKEAGRKGWVRVDEGVSVAHFLLVDDTGQCVVSPAGAEVIGPRKSTWFDGDMRYTEWTIIRRTPVYALGAYTTVTPGGADVDTRQRMSELLENWKRDPQALKARFDRDHNGEIDLKEWELAREEARRQAEAETREERLQPGLNLLHQPDDGRLFLLSLQPPSGLRARFLAWTVGHLVVFCATGVAAFAM